MSVRSTLFFAHANGFPGGSYDTFLGALEPRRKVVVHDRIGHDPRFPPGPGWHELSREIEQALAECTPPVTALGHSMGGVLLFMVASCRPEWFDALIMMDPPLVNGWRSLLFGLGRTLGQADRITPAGQSRGRRDQFRNWDDVRGYFESRGLFRGLDPRCLDDYLRAGLEPDGEGGWRLRFESRHEVEIFRTTPLGLDRWPTLQVPGLLLSGEASHEAFRRCARRHARAHGMLFRSAPGGHMFPLEYPETAAARVEQGLREAGVHRE